MSESEQITLVEAFHEQAGIAIKEGAAVVHAGIHAAVESQAASGVEPVQETLDRLVREGLDRHEAIHAIGAVLSDEMFNIVTGKQAGYDLVKYRKRLEKLTAKRWLQGC